MCSSTASGAAARTRRSCACATWGCAPTCPTCCREASTAASRCFRDQIHGETGGLAVSPDEVYGGRILEANPVGSILYSRLPYSRPGEDNEEDEDKTERDDPLWSGYQLGKLHERLMLPGSIRGCPVAQLAAGRQ